jgi:hypothetical protein
MNTLQLQVFGYSSTCEPESTGRLLQDIPLMRFLPCIMQTAVIEHIDDFNRSKIRRIEILDALIVNG